MPAPVRIANRYEVIRALGQGAFAKTLISRHFARKRRLRPFMTHGLLATAKVLDVMVEKIEFEAKLARVRYAFEADGKRRVGSDRILPRITQRWDPGAVIRVLYLPERDYGSVIIGSA
jgi:hypothetical protein